MSKEKITEIRTLRFINSISQAELAKEIGHNSNSFISQIEKGKTKLSEVMYARIIKAIEAIKARE